MSLVTYPKPTPPYAGYVSELRVHLNRAVSFVTSRPGSKSSVGAQIDAALAAIGYTSVPVSTKAIVSSGQVLNFNGKAITLTVVGNVITNAVVV